jgi:isoleucyl-tRNA synthetase
VGRVTEALESSDTLSATQALVALLDDLSNWYVRRSRRRFWKSEHDADKNTAYETLYHVMVRLVKILAPFIPFITETIYQNLVRSVRPEAYESVHHTAWPQVDPTALDESLLEQMELARQVASLGLSARNAAGLKVRQPLARVLVYAGGRRSLTPELVDIVMDELNVKAFEFVEQAGALVNFRILPDNKLLGPRFGARFPRVRQALAELDPAKVAGRVTAGQPVTLEVDGEPVELAPEDVLVETKPAEGLAVAADKLATVAVDAHITPELKAEGLARELVRRIQSMRKEAGFDIADRIITSYQAQEELASVFQAWSDYIQAETLTTRLLDAPPQDGAYVEEHQVDGETLTLGVKRRD